MRVLDQVRTDFSVDSDRIYLTGVSTGAKAAWHALFRHAEVFAAALIVAGVLQPRRPNGETTSHQRLAQRIRDVAVWVFHGDNDPVFPVTDARDVVAALTSPEAATQPDGAERPSERSAQSARAALHRTGRLRSRRGDVAYYSPRSPTGCSHSTVATQPGSRPVPTHERGAHECLLADGDGRSGDSSAVAHQRRGAAAALAQGCGFDVTVGDLIRYQARATTWQRPTPNWRWWRNGSRPHSPLVAVPRAR